MGIFSRFTAATPQDLSKFENKVYSQNGEDGVIAEIFKRIGTKTQFAVEFGVEDGRECNTRLLKEQGWDVLQMDGGKNNPRYIKHEFITAENINKLFKKYNVPKHFDLLCIDIDTNDFWVWKALSDIYQPRVLIIEYNASIAPTESKVVAYDPNLTWDGSQYFGGSLLAMYRLAKKKGYELVYCDKMGVNAFFVRKDCTDNLQIKQPIDAYRGAAYGELDSNEMRTGHRPTKRKFLTIGTDLEPV